MSLLTFDWKIAALIAEGHALGQPAPVVYVSGEEVIFCVLILVRHIPVFLIKHMKMKSYWLIGILSNSYSENFIILYLVEISTYKYIYI